MAYKEKILEKFFNKQIKEGQIRPEYWVKIRGFENYMLSNLGRVIRVSKTSYKSTSNGIVYLNFNNKQVKRSIPKLLKLYFGKLNGENK